MLENERGCLRRFGLAWANPDRSDSTNLSGSPWSINSMSLTAEAIYHQLGSLIAEMPDLARGPITAETNRWLGRAVVLVERIADAPDVAWLKVYSQNLDGPLRESNAQGIAAIVHQALAKAELQVPAASQGAFIAAGDTFDAFAAVGKVLASAKSDALIVDPYADATVLMDYATLAPEAVTVRLLARSDRSALIKPAADRWIEQFDGARPLEVRLAPAKTLHDRLILVDSETVFVLGQSFNPAQNLP